MPPAPRLEIAEHELLFRATRAGGPGGQHVNKTSTRIELWWNVWMTSALTPEQRARIEQKLASRIDDDGWIRIVAADSRSQLQNREAARKRLETLVGKALVVPKTRRATRIPRAEKAKRLEAKRRRGTVKRQRRPPRGDD